MSSRTFWNSLARRRRINLRAIREARNNIQRPQYQPLLVDHPNASVPQVHEPPSVPHQPQPVCIIECGALVMAKLDRTVHSSSIFEDTLQSSFDAVHFEVPMRHRMPASHSTLTTAGYDPFGPESVALTIATHMLPLGGNQPIARPFVVTPRGPHDDMSIGIVIGRDYLPALHFPGQRGPIQANPNSPFDPLYSQPPMENGLDGGSSSIPDFSSAQFSSYGVPIYVGNEVGFPYGYPNSSYSYEPFTDAEEYNSTGVGLGEYEDPMYPSSGDGAGSYPNE
ncbi:hypothetical protein F5Y14DRAFT_399313 [Nemania sp. NC0429]|nr:hypothetical protein F5Y14DRAFT_399313 [Nemania sp. NC0429]